MKKFFCAFLVALMLFAFVGCNDAKTNGKTIIGTFENAECYVMTDVLSLNVGEYESLFVISDKVPSVLFDTHINEKKIPCKIIVIENSEELRDYEIGEEFEDGKKLVFVKDEKDTGHVISVVMSDEDFKKKTEKTYIVKTYLPDDRSPFGYTERTYRYDHDTQTWK